MTGKAYQGDIVAQGYSASPAGTIQITNATVAAMTGVTVTLTSTGGGLLCIFQAQITSTGAGAPSFAMQLDGADWTTTVQTFPTGTTNATVVIATLIDLAPYSNPGTHTVALRWAGIAGQTVSTGASTCNLTVVELER